MSLQRSLHHYTDLPDNDIRLLRLLPHQDADAPIKCQLFNCGIVSSGGTRPYEALSYVWGSDHESQSISIDSCYLPVGGNLFAALLHLRDPDIERILWIDAVCINQQDNTEKGHQVQSMAKIYAKATRVIVWLGTATPDIEQALEDIRIAGFAAKQTIMPTINENAVLKLLEAAWFRRVWVLQEVAAARHIVVKCGHAEIDGYAFFSGLNALELPYENQPGLKPLVMSVAYLAKGAAFRSRCTTSQAGRFSLNICRLAQLVDMYRNRQASDNRDRIYALLGMSSDDPGTSGLLADYDISWAKLFKQLVNSILGSVPVNTWDDKAVAVIRGKGCVLGQVESVDANIDQNGKQRLKVRRDSPFGLGTNKSHWRLEVSAEPVEAGDVVCLLQGATLPTIIRIHNDYWNIIVIAAASPKRLQVAMSDDKSELPQRPEKFPHEFLLVWDWDLSRDGSKRGTEYEDLMGHLVSQAPQAGLQTDCEKIARFWNNGMAMRDAKLLRWSRGEENLRKALEILEHVLRNMDKIALAGLDRGHRMVGDDMKELQGIVDLILKDKGGSRALCLAAEAGCEAVVSLLLDTGEVDPNTPDDSKLTPLQKAVRKGDERIVKLLLRSDGINPDITGHPFERTPLVEASGNGYEEIVKLLINTGKANVNGRGFQKTPLIMAAENGHTAFVEILLSTSEVEPDFGVDPKERECNDLLSNYNMTFERHETRLTQCTPHLDLLYFNKIPEKLLY
ncbi:uncharacterized protein FIESC28_02477 [Fusarium coffeatum]|uniref:Heterokaryon incompatibility domain-containing protein n=1 Tax=Fusarium coffeatum TaxID=231269 RepID=A0A366S5V7_9HYPO|nr:uncharacterized protein FIESC28_02477 [Fusarium coffeatum]RBR24704.1 hypothetical protein FIESC28_02477 [Fusarium coffeatum]